MENKQQPKISLSRKVTLVPNNINLRISDNRICIVYNVIDDSTSRIVGNEVFLNFTPSDALMKRFQEEIEIVLQVHGR